MTIRAHRVWKELKHHVKVERYYREGGNRNPRFRIEIRSSIPAELLVAAKKATAPCVACGKRIHPIRTRTSKGRGTGHAYYACSCPLTVSVGCSPRASRHSARGGENLVEGITSIEEELFTGLR